MDDAFILHDRVTHRELKITSPAYLTMVAGWNRSQPEINAFTLTLLAHVVGGSQADPAHWRDGYLKG